MKKVLITVALVAASLVLPAGGALAGGSDAIPADYVTWDNCTAKFVRSSSGIINETDRSCTGQQNPWTSEEVWLQFRPLSGRPNPACDMNGGLVTEFDWYTQDLELDGYFDLSPTNNYHVCVYLVDPVVAAGSLDSADADGVTIDLPLAGRYKIDVAGYWDNGPWWGVDAEWVEQSFTGGNTGDTSLRTWLQGWPGLGEGFGDVLVNSSDINWGGYTSAHAYSYTGTFGSSLTLAVFDTYHGDNVGSLSYTVTYLGP